VRRAVAVVRVVGSPQSVPVPCVRPVRRVRRAMSDSLSVYARSGARRGGIRFLCCDIYI